MYTYVRAIPQSYKNIGVDCHILGIFVFFFSQSGAQHLLYPCISRHILIITKGRHCTRDNNAVAEHDCCWWKNVAPAGGQYLKGHKSMRIYEHTYIAICKLTVASFRLRSVRQRWFCCSNTLNCHTQKQQQQQQLRSCRHSCCHFKRYIWFVVVVAAVAVAQVQFSIMQFSLKTPASVSAASDTTADAATVAVATSASYPLGFVVNPCFFFFSFFHMLFAIFSCASCLARPACQPSVVTFH